MASGSKDTQLMELKDTILQLNETIKIQNATMTELRQLIDELKQLNANKQAEIDLLKAKLFGSSSEKGKIITPGQMNLLEDLPDDRTPIDIEPELVESTPEKKERKKKAKYTEMFGNIPVRQVLVNTLTDEEKTCSICGSEMIPIGTEIIRTELIFHPAKLERVDYIGTTYECPNCKDSLEPQFIKDEGEKALVPHSYVSSSLAAHVMYAKFVNAMPFYRQEKDFETLYNVKISRGTMANWAIYCSKNYFEPVYDFLHRQLLKRNFLCADETPIQVLKEEGRRPETKSYVWLFRTGTDGDYPIILYHYAPTRNGDTAVNFLAGAPKGFYLVADGYGGYNKLKDFKRCCCYAHIRRYLLEAIPKGHENDYSNSAVQGFLYINKLFEYERQYTQKCLSKKQLENRRLKDQKPVIEAFLQWLDRQSTVKGSRLDRAVTYCQNQRPYMMTYLEDGRCSLSNNISENSIRPITCGRKNWLFSDTVDGVNASMTVYSMIEMAKANDINPQKYLEYILEARPKKNWSDEQLEELLPWNEEVRQACRNN